ncbi:hypothetical protein T12_7660 [Trichinella patagoniensis]|uniref:Uncharacterized protein n=1 Tax=Trichinella patagoniensis TaxID=990121 RepID=A0A0V0Z639_9BILA|nr:hypothetical protein T12_7660 [Trichinella patagoniensis]
MEHKAAVLGVNLNPQTIICDFETALTEKSGTESSGCATNPVTEFLPGDLGHETQSQLNQHVPGHTTPSGRTAEIRPSSTTTQPSGKQQLISTVLIPKLPTYIGDVLQFKGFWDPFEAAVRR